MKKQIFFLFFCVFLNIHFVENCETSTNVETERRIISGVNVVDIKDYPFMVAIIKKKRNKFYCSGTIIQPDWILTAAHCVIGLKAKDIVIRVGSVDAYSGGQLVDVLKVVSRSSNNIRPTIENDVALLGVGNKIKCPGYVGIVELVDENYVFPPPGIYILALGYGIQVSTASSQRFILRKAEKPLMDLDDCIDKYRHHIRQPKDSMFCLDGPDQKQGACSGDSGGPAIYNDKVIGIMSWAKDCENLSYPMVYQSVEHFRSWIDNAIEANS